MSTLFMYTTSAGTPTWRASRMCSRVCGIGPSAADTTRMPPSIWAAPVILFFTSSAMARAIDMGVVARLRLVLHMGGRDRNAARLLLRRLVDLVVSHERGAARLGQDLGDRRRQRRLAMIHMPDRAHIAMRL